MTVFQDDKLIFATEQYIYLEKTREPIDKASKQHRSSYDCKFKVEIGTLEYVLWRDLIQQSSFVKCYINKLKHNEWKIMFFISEVPASKKYNQTRKQKL